MSNHFIPKYFKNKLPLKHTPCITKILWSMVKLCLRKELTPGNKGVELQIKWNPLNNKVILSSHDDQKTNKIRESM